LVVRLQEETRKAANIRESLTTLISSAIANYIELNIITVRSFMKQGDNGLDRIIPKSVFQNAVGFAIFTVVKAGFVVSARAGSGVVIARLEDGSE
jgi:lipid-binding SYLF domain-containing protein